MKSDKLSAMANQIATFLHSYPDEVAINGIAKHIHKFWTPRMCAALRAQAAKGGPALNRLVVTAMTQTETV